MALLRCHECEHEVSDLATACPNCGAPVDAGVRRAPAAAAPAMQSDSPPPTPPRQPVSDYSRLDSAMAPVAFKIGRLASWIRWLNRHPMIGLAVVVGVIVLAVAVSSLFPNPAKPLSGVNWISDSDSDLKLQIRYAGSYAIWTSDPYDGDGLYDAGDWESSGNEITFTSTYLVDDEPWTREWEIVGDTLILRDGSSEETYSRELFDE